MGYIGEKQDIRARVFEDPDELPEAPQEQQATEAPAPALAAQQA